MAFFKKTQPEGISAAEIIEALAALSPADLAEVKSALSGYGEGPAEETDAAEGTPETSEASAEAESAPAETKAEEASAETPADAAEEVPAEAAQEEAKEEKKESDLEERIARIEETLKALFNRLDAQAEVNAEEPSDNIGAPVDGAAENTEKPSSDVIAETRKKYFGF